MYSLSSSSASYDCMLWTRFLFLMELMVEHVIKRIKFGLIILLLVAYFVVWVMASPTCSDYDTVRVLAVNDGKFSA